MKAKEFAVSVQYGGGHHFFIAYYDTYEEAANEAARAQTSRTAEYETRRKRGGPPPTVRVWRYVVAGSQPVVADNPPMQQPVVAVYTSAAPVDLVCECGYPVDGPCRMNSPACMIRPGVFQAAPQIKDKGPLTPPVFETDPQDG